MPARNLWTKTYIDTSYRELEEQVRKSGIAKLFDKEMHFYSILNHVEESKPFLNLSEFLAALKAIKNASHDGNIKEPLETLYKLCINAHPPVHNRQTWDERKNPRIDSKSIRILVENTRNTVDISALEIENSPHDIKALDIAKCLVYEMITDAIPSPTAYINSIIRKQYEDPEQRKKNNERTIKCSHDEIEEELNRANSPAGNLAGKIIDHIRDFKISAALKELIPLTTHLVEKEEHGEDILGTYKEMPNRRLVDARYCHESKSIRPIASTSAEFKRVLAISEQIPEMQIAPKRAQEIAINMMAEFHKEGGWDFGGYHPYDILRMAQNFHGEEPKPQS